MSRALKDCMDKILDDTLLEHRQESGAPIVVSQARYKWLLAKGYIDSQGKLTEKAGAAMIEALNDAIFIPC